MIRRFTPPANRQRSRRWLFGVAGLVAGMLLLLPAPMASAHAFLLGSTPADGATLDTAPSEIRFNFSESVILTATVVDIVDSEGRHYQPTSLALAETGAGQPGTGGGQPGTEEPAQVIATLPPLGPDAYRMSWRTLSSDDLHVTSGVLVFGVGQPVTAAGAEEPTPSVAESLLRAGLFVALALSLGGLLSGRLLRRPGSAETAHAVRRCTAVAGWGAGAGIAAGAALLADQLIRSGMTLGAVVVSRFGEHFLLRELSFGLLLIAALTGRLPATARWARPTLILVGAVGVGVDTALMGHAGAGQVMGQTRVLADAAHLLAAATWAGTVLLAVTVALPLARRAGGLGVAAMLRAFGVPAVGCIAVIVLTGVYLASGVVGSLDAMLLTFYGRTLLLKLAVVAAIGVLGLVNHRRLRRRKSGLPRRTLTLEAVAALVVLIVTGVLTSSQPALEPQFIGDAAAAGVPVRDALAADLQQTLAVRPNRPGKNVILLGVADTRRPAPAPIRAVLVNLIDPQGVAGPSIAGTSLGDGQWSVTTEIGWTTGFQVVVTVQRPGLADVPASYPWALESAASARPVVMSHAPIAAALESISGLLLLVLLFVGGLVARRRHWSRRSPEQSAGIDPEHADPRPEMAESGHNH